MYFSNHKFVSSLLKSPLHEKTVIISILYYYSSNCVYYVR